MKLSVAIATFNEAESIGNCLKSVQGWVDEVVLVDGSSTDNTVVIAKRFEAKIFTEPNHRIFHINKQKAIDHCKGEWIFQLDADEEVSTKLKEEILTKIENTTYDGFWIPRKNYFLGKFLTKGGQYPDYTLRLYRNGKAKLPCKSVHEQAQVSGTVDYCVHPLLHYSYPDFNHYLEHFNRYTDIFADELAQKNTSVHFSAMVDYVLIKPLYWFLSTYIRHKGFVDGFAGFSFCFFSSLRFPTSYIKFWEKKKRKS